VHTNPDILGDVVKSARKKAEITMEALANKVGITERYLYRIENEKKKPSFDVLVKLIRELAISPDLIFYPEKPSKDSEAENLIRMLYGCDERSMKIIKATIKAALESQTEAQQQDL
jgi:transcriptional regulator with XRE-family HTH domain